MCRCNIQWFIWNPARIKLRLENFCAEVQLLVNFSQTKFSQKLSIPKLHSWCMWNPWLIHHIFNVIIIFFYFCSTWTCWEEKVRRSGCLKSVKTSVPWHSALRIRNVPRVTLVLWRNSCMYVVLDLLMYFISICDDIFDYHHYFMQ